MKKHILTLGLLLLTVMASFSQDENLALTFSNAMLTNDGTSDFYEVDIIATRTSAVDFKIGDGQFYINYNPAAFGIEIDDTTVDFDYTPGSILSEVNFFPIYDSPIIQNRSNGIVSIAYEQSLSSGSMAENNIVSEGRVLGHLKIQMININEDPQISFDITGPDFTNGFFTACGDTTPGPALKNCGVVGVDYFQILGYDGTDNSGAALPVELCAGGTTTFTTQNMWDPMAPDNTMSAIIEGTYLTEIQGDLEACELTIAEGGSLIVSANSYARIQNDITNDGVFSVLPTGSLVQVNDDAVVTNNSSLSVLIETPELEPRDFMIIGSPMTNDIPEIAPDPMNPGNTPHEIFRKLNHTTSSFSPNQDVQDEFPNGANFVDQEGDDWTTYTGIYTAGEGFYTNPQESLQDGDKTYTILYEQNATDGTMNNGIINYALGYNMEGTPAENKNASPNLLSNPYPSAISALDFLNANDAIDELYLWEHNTTPGAFPGWLTANFNMADISIFNSMGFSPAMTGSPTPATMGDFSISTGQGFGVKNNGATTNTGQTAVFNNSMRRVDNNNTLRNQTADKNRLWISVKNSDYQLQSTTLVGFVEDGTPLFDAKYDSDRIGAPLGIYSHHLDGTGALAIQGREAFNDAIEVGIGFSSQVALDAAEYSISLITMDGELFQDQPVYLRDNLTGMVTALKNEPYTFTSGQGTFDNRFTLFFRDAEILNNQDIALNNISLYPNPAKDLINISSPATMIDKIQLLDMKGSVLLMEENVASNLKTIDVSTLQSAVYFVIIETEQGTINRRFVKQN
ncbi:MAG: T9SS type A sorting domain-containing protein [Patiriisocius sp.]|uniref:T9SS type A sorting domain-containing protein n=1 Tax=Patiriisocius sp. TaxID=2822396 RepID=UPI003EF97DA8